tara:strand:- start:186 stop:407 length:222 start_codon:yes stop_codon:yes gene_type:complete
VEARVFQPVAQAGQHLLVEVALVVLTACLHLLAVYTEGVDLLVIAPSTEEVTVVYALFGKQQQRATMGSPHLT